MSKDVDFAYKQNNQSEIFDAHSDNLPKYKVVMTVINSGYN